MEHFDFPLLAVCMHIIGKLQLPKSISSAVFSLTLGGTTIYPKQLYGPNTKQITYSTSGVSDTTS